MPPVTAILPLRFLLRTKLCEAYRRRRCRRRAGLRRRRPACSRRDCVQHPGYAYNTRVEQYSGEHQVLVHVPPLVYPPVRDHPFGTTLQQLRRSARNKEGHHLLWRDPMIGGLLHSILSCCALLGPLLRLSYHARCPVRSLRDRSAHAMPKILTSSSKVVDFRTRLCATCALPCAFLSIWAPPCRMRFEHQAPWNALLPSLPRSGRRSACP